jgi:hypothetical protein
MTDVVVTELRSKKAGRKAKTAVREKHLRDSQGRTVRVLSLDANSATFADDLTDVFERNVARARRENKRLFGTPDGSRARKK